MEKIHLLDGRNLYYSFLAGAGKMMKYRQHLDQINVFPIADADTGTNLASTFRSVFEIIRPADSFALTAGSLAEAALDGARGNSGIIFAQFLHGLSNVGLKEKCIDIRWFAALADKAATYAREAIADPVEGTMITVMRDWADAVNTLKEKTDDFHQLIVQSHKTALSSLQETTRKLPALARANVVDAGAKGFVLFLEGITELLKHRSIRTVLRNRQVTVGKAPRIEQHMEPSAARYCAEAILSGENLDPGHIREVLKDQGDSLVVAGSARKVKVHLHTDRPAEMFDRLGPIADLPRQKVEDMHRQYEVEHDRKWDIALVTDSTCDMPIEIIDRYQINVVPVNIIIGENSYLDKITMTPDQFYSMAHSSSRWPTSSQPGVKSFLDTYSLLAQHYESIIAVHLSKEFSGTWANSKTAAEKVSAKTGKRITVINSKHLSGSMGLLILRAAKAIEAGMGHDEVESAINRWISGTRLMVSIVSLKYLVKGGRLSPMKGILANLLNFKPILSVSGEGRLVLHSKAFGRSGNRKKVLRIIEKELSTSSIWGYSIVHAHDHEAADWFARRMESLTGSKPEFIYDISPAIGVHAGQGAAAVALMKE